MLSASLHTAIAGDWHSLHVSLSHHYTMDPALSPLRLMQPATARYQDDDPAQTVSNATALAVSVTDATLSDLGMHDIMFSCPCARGREKRDTGAFWCTLSNSCHSVQHRDSTIQLSH